MDGLPEEQAEDQSIDRPRMQATSSTVGETRRHEDNVLDILEEDFGRLWRGTSSLCNQIL